MIDRAGFLVEISHGESLLHVGSGAASSSPSTDAPGLKTAPPAEHARTTTRGEGRFEIAQAHRREGGGIVHLGGGDGDIFHDGCGGRGFLLLFHLLLDLLLLLRFLEVGDVEFLLGLRFGLFFEFRDGKKNASNHHYEEQGKQDNCGDADGKKIGVLAGAKLASPVCGWRRRRSLQQFHGDLAFVEMPILVTPSLRISSSTRTTLSKFARESALRVNFGSGLDALMEERRSGSWLIVTFSCPR